MSAFRPISPHSAIRLLEEADVGVDPMRLLADLAEAGLVKSYARLTETRGADESVTAVRDKRISSDIWRQIISAGKIDDIFSTGSARMEGNVSVLAIRFDEQSVRAAAADHGAKRPEVSCSNKAPNARSTEQVTVEEASEQPAEHPVIPSATGKFGVLPEGVLNLTIKEAGEVLRIGRTSVNKRMDEGVLKKVKVGRRTLITVESVRALMEG